jgi:hypothetical protein
MTDPLHSSVEAARSGWVALERDWQSIVVGATIVATVVVFEVQIPW